MPGKPSQSKPLQYVGALVAVVAVVGTVAFGWEFGATDDLAPVALGVVFAVVAIGATLYRYRYR